MDFAAVARKAVADRGEKKVLLEVRAKLA